MALLTSERQRYRERHDLWDKFWKDKNGNVVVWQTPNALLIVWVVLTLVSLFTNGKFSNVVWWLAIVDLAAWSLLEVFKGVNYLRRFVGIVVLIMTIMAAMKAAT